MFIRIAFLKVSKYIRYYVLNTLYNMYFLISDIKKTRTLFLKYNIYFPLQNFCTFYSFGLFYFINLLDLRSCRFFRVRLFQCYIVPKFYSKWWIVIKLCPCFRLCMSFCLCISGYHKFHRKVFNKKYLTPA